MAKKSKGFADLLRQERNEDIEGRSMNQLKRKIKNNPLGQKMAGMVTNPEGMDKMSEVLQVFVDPYLKSVTNSSQRETLFDIAVMAWNLSLTPENERQSLVEEMLEQLAQRGDLLAQQEMREIIEELITRKLELFPDNRRLIVEFHLQETRNKFHLSVASTLMD
jgi:uncharacterized membrane-anchored protein YjiN (DUF445 family)